MWLLWMSAYSGLSTFASRVEYNHQEEGMLTVEDDLDFETVRIPFNYSISILKDR